MGDAKRRAVAGEPPMTLEQALDATEAACLPSVRNFVAAMLEALGRQGVAPMNARAAVAAAMGQEARRMLGEIEAQVLAETEVAGHA